MIDTTVPRTLWVVATSLMGMIAIGAGLIGYWMRSTHWLERILAVVAGLLLIYPEGYSDTIGLVMFIGLLVLQYVIKRDHSNKAVPAKS